MRYLSTAYVRSHRAKVGHRRGALVVSTPEGRHKIPLEGIDALILLGAGQITSQALATCVRRGVRVTSLYLGGAIRFVVGGKTSGNVHLRSAQHHALTDPDQSLEISRVIVAAKIQSSRTVIRRWARDERDSGRREALSLRAEQMRDRVVRVREADSPNLVRGIEGDAARIHFRALELVLSKTRLPFSGRNRRPPRDPVNALLGFTYSLVVTECIGALESVGLDYQLGFLHRPRSGRPSLALDLTEEFRAWTDRFVVGLIRRRQMTADDFTQMPGGGVYLTDEGRSKLLLAWESHKEGEVLHRVTRQRVERWAVPSVQATLLARHLRGDLPAYAPFVLP